MYNKPDIASTGSRTGQQLSDPACQDDLPTGPKPLKHWTGQLAQAEEEECMYVVGFPSCSIPICLFATSYAHRQRRSSIACIFSLVSGSKHSAASEKGETGETQRDVSHFAPRGEGGNSNNELCKLYVSTENAATVPCHFAKKTATQNVSLLSRK